jgi:hypothetical protein
MSRFMSEDHATKTQPVPLERQKGWSLRHDHHRDAGNVFVFVFMDDRLTRWLDRHLFTGDGWLWGGVSDRVLAARDEHKAQRRDGTTEDDDWRPPSKALLFDSASNETSP